MTSMVCTPLVAVQSPGSVPPRLEALHPGIPVHRLTDVPAQAVLRQAMQDALDCLHRTARRGVPAFVAAAPYSAYTATFFAERHEDPARRLRPSHSIQMECSRLVQGLDDHLDAADRWQGDVVFLCTPDRDVRQAVRSAQAVLATGAPAALVGEITVTPGRDDGKPALSAAAMLLLRRPAEAAVVDVCPWRTAPDALGATTVGACA